MKLICPYLCVCVCGMLVFRVVKCENIYSSKQVIYEQNENGTGKKHNIKLKGIFAASIFQNVKEKGEKFFSFSQGKLVCSAVVRHLESDISLSSPTSCFSIHEKKKKYHTFNKYMANK